MKAELEALAVVAVISFALAGCSPREGRDVDYSMAGLLAGKNSRSGTLAREGLADGYLSAAEAEAMWAAYRAEGDAQRARQKAEAIAQWSKSALATPPKGTTDQ